MLVTGAFFGILLIRTRQAVRGGMLVSVLMCTIWHAYSTVILFQEYRECDHHKDDELQAAPCSASSETMFESLTEMVSSAQLLANERDNNNLLSGCYRFRCPGDVSLTFTLYCFPDYSYLYVVIADNSSRITDRGKWSMETGVIRLESDDAIVGGWKPNQMVFLPFKASSQSRDPTETKQERIFLLQNIPIVGSSASHMTLTSICEISRQEEDIKQGYSPLDGLCWIQDERVSAEESDAIKKRLYAEYPPYFDYTHWSHKMWKYIMAFISYGVLMCGIFLSRNMGIVSSHI
jgi:hypothetical protein